MNGEAPVEFAALCLAPAFDETVAPGAAPGAHEHPGGKGLNVARWLAARGRAAALGGLLGADDAAPFEAEMRARGVRDATLRVPGPVRRNVFFAGGHPHAAIERRAAQTAVGKGSFVEIPDGFQRGVSG